MSMQVEREAGPHAAFRRGAIRRGQKGVSLVAATAGLALAAVTIIGSLAAVDLARKSSEGRAVGDNMRRLNGALDSYLVTHYETLITLPVACSKTSFAEGTSLPGVNLTTTACSMTVGGHTVVNGMQPSVADLRALGFLNAGVKDDLSLPYTRVVAEADPLTGAKSTAPARARYAMRIQHVCVPDAPPRPTSSLPCNGQGVDLTALLFNTQPFHFQPTAGFTFGAGAQLGAALGSMGGDGAISRLTGDGQGALIGYLDQFTIDNPIKDANGTGYPGILAMRTGYGSSNWSQFTRRDGSAMPTADWNFNNKSVTNMANLQVNKDIKAGGDLTVDGNALVKGTATANGNLRTKSNLTVDKNAEIGGNLNVAGDATIKGVTTVSKLKLPGQTEGGSCNPSIESIGRMNPDQGRVLLICDKTTGTWTRIAGSDFKQVQFNSRGTRYWTVPSGVTQVIVTMAGGGAGGCYIPAQNPGGLVDMVSGGSGGFFMDYLVKVVPGSNLEIRVGGAGAGGTSVYGKNTGSGTGRTVCWSPAGETSWIKGAGVDLRCTGGGGSLNPNGGGIGQNTPVSGTCNVEPSQGIQGTWIMRQGASVPGAQTPIGYGSGGATGRCWGGGGTASGGCSGRAENGSAGKGGLVLIRWT